jgi:membrane fusion protein, multidrug efflux system
VLTLLKRLVWILCAVAAIGTVYYASTKEPVQQAGQGQGKGKRGGGGGDQPIPVLAGTTRTQNIPVYLEGVGAAKALNTVTIKPQVDGKITKITFREGQLVKRGDIIAEIDPTTYKAQLDQAIAKKSLTETQLTNARRDFDRYQGVAKGVIAQKTVDTQQSQVAQFEAQLKADIAAVASAQAVLDFTRVVSPIDGRTGIRMIDEGNLVRASDAGLVVISQIQPITVIFSLPQQNLQKVSKAMAAGVLAAEAMDSDNKTVLDKGILQVVDNLVDQTTGTVRLKAEFPNAQMQLWPGQFANIRLLVDTLNQVVVAPTPAVQRGPSGPFVYVVGDGERVTIRPVTVGQQTESESVITQGLTTGERIITTGFARLRDGAQVAIGEALDPKTAPTPAAMNKEGRPRGEGKRGDGSGRRGGDAKVDSGDAKDETGGGKKERKGKRPAETSAAPSATPATVPPAAVAQPAAAAADRQGKTQ